jgi:hypothetical protein
MSLPHQALPLYEEGRILLAIQALKLGYIQSVRAAVVAYDIPRLTLQRRINGIASRRDTISNI